MQAILLLLCSMILCVSARGQSSKRALLASPGLDAQPIKGVYFFPGESADNLNLYTTHPTDPDDQHWNSVPSSQARVINRIVAAHVNTIIMSYWGDMPQWSPMRLDSQSVPALINAVRGHPLVIVPSLEGGSDPGNPATPQWQFQTDFPAPLPGGPIAPGLVRRIGQLVSLFQGRMDSWARLYDRNGNWRYAVYILHVCSDQPEITDAQFADAFENVAGQVRAAYHIPVGFMLDIIGGCHYVATPGKAGPLLEQRASVLAVNGYESEVFSGKVINGPSCPAPNPHWCKKPGDWVTCGGTQQVCPDPDWRHCKPQDNNKGNLENLADWKRSAVQDWVVTGLPLILDVSNGMDGRIVWATCGASFWGDNMNYTDDRWRNWLSELKGTSIKGITVDTWNGYTEGYAMVPSVEHDDTDYNWLTDLLDPDPRQCSHMHYAQGSRTFRVYGAICEKWVELGADRGFGVPVSGEEASVHGRVSLFADGKAIYWSGATGAHEVHGLIAETYSKAGADGSCLGLPVSDEEPSGNSGGRVSKFQYGQIDWKPGDRRGHITCY